MAHTNFKLSAGGEFVVLSDSAGTIIDQINPGSLETGHSYGRSPDGGSIYCVFTDVSPGSSNGLSTCYKGYEPQPEFSLTEGFYPGPQTVTVSTTSPTAEIRYTWDGSEPTLTSPLISGPLSIPSSVSLRARAFSSINYLPSRSATRSFFIGEGDISLPVFSITTDPVELFDSETGIYFNAEGGDDGGDPENEIDAHLAYFDKTGEQNFEKRFALQMHGGGSLGFDQKSLRIDTKEKIDGDINYPLFSDKPDVDRFNNLTLRNGGNENQDRIIADAFMQRAV